MSDVAIRVEGLGKRYRIGARQEKYKTLRDTLTSGAFRPFHAVKSFARRNGHKVTSNSKLENGNRKSASQSKIRSSRSDLIWALRDVSFEVKRGEVVGIIGRNGAGKSTLLKILSRITEPTEGYADIHGRVGSLLEVGTGFHSELTGRENIYLNGAILGMKKTEIENKFDEIVSFAEVEKFIGTPVKHYSSGMYLRLAFAVAAHLEPEILIVDEVLAVGDVGFQKKCLGKMSEVAGEGRTILFVSHNMPAVKSLCCRAIFLKDGRVDLDGDVQIALERYTLRGVPPSCDGLIPENAHSYNSGEAIFERIELVDFEGELTHEIFYRQPLRFKIKLDVLNEIREALLDIKVVTRDGLVITHSMNTFNGSDPIPLRVGNHEYDVEVDNQLFPGNYSITLGVHHSNGRTIDYVEHIYDFSILKIAQCNNVDYKYSWTHGFIRAESSWKSKGEIGQ